jgi:hypothetical protein
VAKADDREDTKEQGDAGRREAELQELRELHFELIGEAQGLKNGGDEGRLAEVRRQLEQIDREIAELERNDESDEGESRTELERIRREVTEFFESQHGEHDEHHEHEHHEHEHHEHEHHEHEHHEHEAIELEQRIHHLHEAAENLERAGCPDMAHEVIQQAERLERELERHHALSNPERMLWEIHEMLHDMRREMSSLREEIRDLRERLER